MNKSELVRATANKAGITLKDADLVIESFLQAITDEITKGEKVQISGFGTFELKKKKAREAINPKTGNKIKVDASVTPIFKFGKAYKDSFNK